MTDQELIIAWGGPAKVAELLGYDKLRGGVQRVQNWMTRGIPAQVKLDNPHLFLGFTAKQIEKRVAERRAADRRVSGRRITDKRIP